MNKHHIIALATLFILAPTLSLAHEGIVRPYQTVRSSGMGGTRLTTGLYDDNFFGNPARVTANPVWRIQLFNLTAETTTSTVDNVSNISGEDAVKGVASTAGDNNHGRIQMSLLSFYFPNVGGGKMSYAFGLLANGQMDFALRRSYQLNPQSIIDIGPAFTVGRKFLENDALSVGVTPHLTYRLASSPNYGMTDLIQGESLSPSQSGGEGTHFDIDLGATYRLPIEPIWEDVTLDAALSANNILGGSYKTPGTKLVKDLGPAPEQPRAFGVGISARMPSLWKFTDATLAFEIQNIGNNANGSMFRLFHIGGEVRYGVLAPRIGINQGYWAAGLGIYLKVIELEFASYGEELSLNVGGLEDRRYAFRLGLQI